MFKTTLLSLLTLTALAWQQERPRSSRPLKEERMTLEYNATLGEAVVTVEAESEGELERIQVEKPGGERLFVLESPIGSLPGLSGFKIELTEGTLPSILATYAQGTYDIRARTAGGGFAVGSATLSLELPAAPLVLVPHEGALVPGAGLVVRWLADRSASGYELQLEQDENDGLTIHLPPGRSSFAIPEGFLAGGTATQLEIAALGSNGNRTVSEVHFTTR